MASDPVGDTAYEAAVRSWVEHLRGGGTTPWADWADAPELPRADGADRAAKLPGAAQLELLRRVNLEGPVPALVDHILDRPGPGRGRVHLPLPWPPARPAAPAPEVRRVAVGVLADLTARLEETAGTARSRSRVRPTRRRTGQTPSFVLEGLPMTVAGLRDDLAAGGLVERRQQRRWGPASRRRARPDCVLVIGGPIDQALGEAWTRRALDGSPRSWRGFLKTWSARRALPPSADLGLAIRHWSQRLGPAQVHVIMTSHDDDAGSVHRHVEELFGVPVVAATQLPAGGALTPVQTDLLRRVNAVLPFLLPEEARPPHRAALAALMREEPLGPRSVGLPRRRQAWAEAAGERVVDTVRASGATVHGELAALSRPATAGRGIRAGDSVAAAVRMIHRVQDRSTATGGGTAGGGADR